MQEKRLFEKLLTDHRHRAEAGDYGAERGSPAGRLVTAIRAADHGSLVKIPGIGKKTAERIVLELKDKLDDLQGFATSATSSRPATPSMGAVADDALSALVNLGYPRPTAQKAVETAIEKDPAVRESFEVLFRAAMNQIR